MSQTRSFISKHFVKSGTLQSEQLVFEENGDNSGAFPDLGCLFLIYPIS